ncbi:MAG: hypothetical protein KC550_06900, partial [Nanoarchaeota archaeon]|nr:hypothetical protein [Nanoarchaeota archaeon]
MKYSLPFYESTKIRFQEELDPIKKTFRLVLLCEELIKFHTVVVVQNYLHSSQINSEGKAYLGKGLKRPSLSIWAFFTEMIHPLIKKENLFWKDFPEYFNEILKHNTLELIRFRNRIHHGTTPTEKSCIEDIDKYYPIVLKIESAGIIGR